LFMEFFTISIELNEKSGFRMSPALINPISIWNKDLSGLKVDWPAFVEHYYILSWLGDSRVSDSDLNGFVIAFLNFVSLWHNSLYHVLRLRHHHLRLLVIHGLRLSYHHLWLLHVHGLRLHHHRLWLLHLHHWLSDCSHFSFLFSNFTFYMLFLTLFILQQLSWFRSNAPPMTDLSLLIILVPWIKSTIFFLLCTIDPEYVYSLPWAIFKMDVCWSHCI
jgi:hypothetical protein